MIQAVLFDMDGLMFDTERLWGTFWAPALAEFGLPYREGLAQAARGTAGETLRGVLRSYYGPDCPAEAILDRFHQLAVETFRKPVPKKPGLDELLAWLDEKGIPMAVVSSSSEAVIRRNLDNWGLGRYSRPWWPARWSAIPSPTRKPFCWGRPSWAQSPPAALCWRTATTGCGPARPAACHRDGARPDAGDGRDAGAFHRPVRQPVRGAGQAEGR